MPRPPAKVRPRELSITEVEPLMRSPYDIYARRVLRLQRLDPLGAQPDAKERGSMIHRQAQAVAVPSEWLPSWPTTVVAIFTSY